MGTVMMLDGQIEVTVKIKKESGCDTDTVKVGVAAPKYDLYILEEDVRGMKQTLEISPSQDFEHLDERLQFISKQVQQAIKMCQEYDKRAMDSGTVTHHSQLPLVYKPTVQ